MTGWGKWSNNGGEPNRRGGFALPGTEMNLLWSQANVTDGVAQEARLPYALEPGFFLPQERKIHDHLALASRMVELVRLPSGSGGPSMHWGALFKSEPAVAIFDGRFFGSSTVGTPTSVGGGVLIQGDSGLISGVFVAIPEG